MVKEESDIDGCPIGGVNLRCLSAVWCSRLTSTSIVQLVRLPDLRRLEVLGCPAVDSSAIDPLRAKGVLVNNLVC